jgi:hypothetical protein
MAFSLLAMIFYLFFSVTSLSLYALSTSAQLLVLFDRLGDVFKMEEYKKVRKEDCAPTECGVTAKDAAFSWGYRVKDDQSAKKNF